MVLTPEHIAAYQTIVSDPKKHGLSFRAITECFEKSETVTPKHLLAKSYMDNEATQLHKLVCYIIMDNIFGQCNGKAESGQLGYYLKYIPNGKEEKTGELASSV